MKQNYLHLVLLSSTLGVGVIGGICYYLHTIYQQNTDFAIISYACLGAFLFLGSEYFILQWQNENIKVFSYAKLLCAVLAIVLIGCNLLFWHNDLVTILNLVLIMLSLAFQVVKNELVETKSIANQ